MDSPLEIKDKIERWVSDSIYPPPIIDFKIAILSKKSILAISVENTNFPVYTFDGQYYQRIGTSSVPVPPEKMADLIRGRPIEDILRSIEANISITQASAATAHSLANIAMTSIAPAIAGQGDLATLNYSQLRDAIFRDLGQSPLIKSLEAGMALAQSLASLAMSSVAPAVQGQGDLATLNYDTIRQRLLEDFDVLNALRNIEARCAVLDSSLAFERAMRSTLEQRVATLESKLKSLAT